MAATPLTKELPQDVAQLKALIDERVVEKSAKLAEHVTLEKEMQALDTDIDRLQTEAKYLLSIEKRPEAKRDPNSGAVEKPGDSVDNPTPGGVE